MIVSETVPASCPCSGAIQFAGRFFAARDASRHADAARTLPPPSYQIVADGNFVSRSRDALALKWTHHDYLVPASFRGSLTVRPARDGSELTLVGTSSAENSATLKTAMRSLLRQIVTHVDREWTNFEANCASVATCNARSARAVKPRTATDLNGAVSIVSRSRA